MKDKNIHNHYRNEKSIKSTINTLRAVEKLATAENPSDIPFIRQDAGLDEPNRNPNEL